MASTIFYQHTCSFDEDFGNGEWSWKGDRNCKLLGSKWSPGLPQMMSQKIRVSIPRKESTPLMIRVLLLHINISKAGMSWCQETQTSTHPPERALGLGTSFPALRLLFGQDHVLLALTILYWFEQKGVKCRKVEGCSHLFSFMYQLIYLLCTIVARAQSKVSAEETPRKEHFQAPCRRSYKCNELFNLSNKVCNMQRTVKHRKKKVKNSWKLSRIYGLRIDLGGNHFKNL